MRPTDVTQGTLPELAGMGLPAGGHAGGVGSLTPGDDVGDRHAPGVLGSAIPMAERPATPTSIAAHLLATAATADRAAPNAAASEPPGPLMTQVQMTLEGAIRVCVTLIRSGKGEQAAVLLSSIADQLPVHLRDPKTVGER